MQSMLYGENRSQHSRSNLWYSGHECRLCHLSSSSCFSFPGPVPVVLQGSAGVPGELWPLCNITTPLPGQTSQESAKCPISATIQSLDPLKTQVPPVHPHPHATRVFGRKRGCVLSPGKRIQPITEIHADLSNHMRFFALKILTETLRRHDNGCTDATAQTGSWPLCSVQAKPSWLSKATVSTKRAFSLFLW